MDQNRHQGNKENNQILLNGGFKASHSRAIDLKEISLNNMPVERIATVFDELVSCIPKKHNCPEFPVDSNPQEVTEFQEQILVYLVNKEAQYLVNPFYMNDQTDITPKMRSILIDWLVDVHIKFKLLPQTIFITVNLIDRFLTRSQVTRQNLQLLGITGLMITCKYEEIYPPLLKDYIAVCDGAYTRQQILEMEDQVIAVLNFDMARTSCYTFLEHLQLKVKLEPRALIFSRYILENSLFDLTSLKYSNINLVGGAVFLVNKIFKRGNWKANFEQITGLKEGIARECAKDLFATMQKMETVNLTALKRKFSSVEMFEVSKFRIEKAKN